MGKIKQIRNGKSTITIIDKGWERIQKEIRIFEKSFTKVGLLESSGIHSDSGGLTVVMVGVFHEFGTSRGVPERRWVRRWVEKNKKSIGNKIMMLYGLVIDGKMTAKKSLQLLGAWGEKSLKQFLRDGNITPKLKPATIRRKGSSKVLIDTGQMMNSISHEEAIKR